MTAATLTTGQRLTSFFDKKIAQIYLSASKVAPGTPLNNLMEALENRPVMGLVVTLGAVSASVLAVTFAPSVGLLAAAGGSATAKMFVGLYGIIFTGSMLDKANRSRMALPEEAAARAVRSARPKQEWQYQVEGETIAAVSAESDPGRLFAVDQQKGVKTKYLVQQAIADRMATEFTDQSVARAEKPGSWGRGALYLLTPAAMTAVFGPLPLAVGAATWYLSRRQEAVGLKLRSERRAAAEQAGETPVIAGTLAGSANPSAKADWRYLPKVK